MYLIYEKWGRKSLALSGRNLLPFLKEESLINQRGEVAGGLKIIQGGTVFSKTEGSEEESGVPWTFSTFDKDRDQERIDPRGWDLTLYRKNPVILWAHDNRIPAIGTARDVGVAEEKLAGLIDFNDKEYDEFGWAIGERVKAGVIRAGSVGFMIHKIEVVEEEGKENLVFREQELLEFSLCNVPANPFALNGKATLIPEPVKQVLPARRFYGGLIGN